MIHSTAFVSDEMNIGRGTRIWRYVYVGVGARVGSNCTIGEGAHVGPKVVVGNGCKIQNGAQLFDGVTLEDDVFIGPHVVFTNVLTPRAFIERKHEFESTLVKRGASIGANATIVCGVTIGEYAMVGAGSVVTHDILPFTALVGNPARYLGLVCRCGGPMHLLTGESAPSHGDDGFCPSCGTRYHRDRLSAPFYIVDAKTPAP